MTDFLKTNEFGTGVLGAITGMSTAETTCMLVGLAFDVDTSPAVGALSVAGAGAGWAYGGRIGRDHDQQASALAAANSFIDSDPEVSGKLDKFLDGGWRDAVSNSKTPDRSR